VFHTTIGTEWVGFDTVEGTMEPLYEKCVDVARMLTKHLQCRADDGAKMALKASIKIREFETDQSDHRPATMGNTNAPASVYQKLLHVPVPSNRYH
jgi:hypothetical protein